jgi:hypothetical protein
MTLPATIDEAEAIDNVVGWLEMVREKMTAAYSREWLAEALCDLLRRDAIEVSKIVEAADNGDAVADAALRKVYAEKRDRDETPSVTLRAYGIKAIQRGPVKRKRGRATWHDNWRRDIGIAVLVFLTIRRFGLLPTRNREQRRREQASACSVVSAALGRHHINVDEKRIENIWGRLQIHVGRYLLSGQIESPSNPAI